MTFIYRHVHPCWWIKSTLSFKLQAQGLHSCANHFCFVKNTRIAQIQTPQENFFCVHSSLIAFQRYTSMGRKFTHMNKQLCVLIKSIENANECVLEE
jgi:hypothetical protein